MDDWQDGWMDGWMESEMGRTTDGRTEDGRMIKWLEERNKLRVVSRFSSG